MKLVDEIRRVARSVPAYVDFRRWQREGFGRAVRRHLLWRQILSTSPIRTAPRRPGAAEVHTLCYRLDHLPAIWALKSFYRAAEVDFPLVIHFNGRFDRRIHRRLYKHFPNATIITQEEADRTVGRNLASGGFCRLAEARSKSPFMLKLTDFPILGSAGTILGIDSDVLFFSKPSELLDRVSRPGDGYTFQRDAESTYNITANAASCRLGISLAPRVNTGLLVYDSRITDLAAFERYLNDTDVAVPNGFIEQTLYALHASAINGTSYLSDRYVVDLRSGLKYEATVARHYAGPSRKLMTDEGMPRVIGSAGFERGLA